MIEEENEGGESEEFESEEGESEESESEESESEEGESEEGESEQNSYEDEFEGSGTVQNGWSSVSNKEMRNLNEYFQKFKMSETNLIIQNTKNGNIVKEK